MTPGGRNPAFRWCLAVGAATLSAVLVWAPAEGTSRWMIVIIASLSAVAMAIAFRAAFGFHVLSLLGSVVGFCAVLTGEGWLQSGYVDPLFLVIGLPIAFVWAAAASIVVFYVSRPKFKDG